MTPATPGDLFARLDALGLAHRTVRHRPVFTVDEGADLKAALPGGHTKNLFVKDKKGALFLVCALAETQIDLKALSGALGAGRFSFGSASLLQEALGVTPGSVTVFALINDPAARVRLVLDEALFACPLVHFHPLTNTATTAIAPAALLVFLESMGRTPTRVAFDAAGAPRIAPMSDLPAPD
ncbi:MAG: prolyl-tRNA synthetase associated domain-containing protein [Hyphomonadaceae bacterium]